MFTHAQIWEAIDKLANSHGLSTSGLAKKAGLDPTSFNKSKRLSPDGKERWPSTESISKVLAAVSATMSDFLSLIDKNSIQNNGVKRLPIIKFSQAQENICFDDHGLPVQQHWQEFSFEATNQMNDQHAFAIEISSTTNIGTYRSGEVIVVSPAAEMRVGDRVVLKTNEGDLMISEITAKTARKIDIKTYEDAHDPDAQIDLKDISWMARILWASQ